MKLLFFWKSVIKLVFISKLSQNIRIYHEHEVRIEKSVPSIGIWHHEACRVMTNGESEGQIFLSYPHANNGQFHMMMLLDVLGKIAWIR